MYMCISHICTYMKFHVSSTLVHYKEVYTMLGENPTIKGVITDVLQLQW